MYFFAVLHIIQCIIIILKFSSFHLSSLRYGCYVVYLRWNVLLKHHFRSSIDSSEVKWWRWWWWWWKKKSGEAQNHFHTDTDDDLMGIFFIFPYSLWIFFSTQAHACKTLSRYHLQFKRIEEAKNSYLNQLKADHWEYIELKKKTSTTCWRYLKTNRSCSMDSKFFSLHSYEIIKFTEEKKQCHFQKKEKRKLLDAFTN